MRARSLPVFAVGVVLAGTLAGGGVLVAQRHGGTPMPAAGGVATPPPPTERGLPTAGPSPTISPTGRGRGVARAIPCYLVSPTTLGRLLRTPMGLGQRAAGSSGSGLTGTQRESCYWFADDPSGPYVVISDVTTSQLRDRGMRGWTARKYFDEVPPRSRRYLTGIGDAAYAYGPATLAVLVGDVYLDVTVVSFDDHPLTHAVAVARAAARLQLTGP